MQPQMHRKYPCTRMNTLTNQIYHEMENKFWHIPEIPFLHVGMLSLEQHLGLPSISWPMKEVSLPEWIDGAQHFC